MPRRADASSAKRADLMAAAWRLFYRDGFQRVGIDALLAEAGVAKMTLYHHFASKDELIVALLEEQGARILASLDGAIAAAGPKPGHRFGAVFDWHARWFAQSDFRGCAFLRALAEFPDPGHPVNRAAWRFKQAIRQRLLDLARENGAAKPAALADALSLITDGAIVAAHATGSAAPAHTAKVAAKCLLEQSCG